MRFFVSLARHYHNDNMRRGRLSLHNAKRSIFHCARDECSIHDRRAAKIAVAKIGMILPNLNRIHRAAVKALSCSTYELGGGYYRLSTAVGSNVIVVCGGAPWREVQHSRAKVSLTSEVWPDFPPTNANVRRRDPRTTMASPRRLLLHSPCR